MARSADVDPFDQGVSGPAKPALSRGRFRQGLYLFLSLLGFWLILCGQIDVQRLAIGAVVAGLLTVLWTTRLQRGPAEGDVPTLQLALSSGFILYVGRMIVEIVKASMYVVKIVLARDMPISPHFVMVRTKLRRNLTRVIYATSITLTPGTLSISLQEDTLIVHAITREAAEGVRDWAVEDRVHELEKAWQA